MEHIDLSVPARAEYLALARFHVGTVAARIEMSVDDMDDLNLAVEELCLMLLGRRTWPGGRLCIEINWDLSIVEVTCSLDKSPGPAIHSELDEPFGVLPQSFSNRILDALVDEHGASLDDGQPHAWLRKRREQIVRSS